MSLRWRKLAREPSLWRNRFIYYCWRNPNVFVDILKNVHTQIEYLHLGGHRELEEKALQALLSVNVTHVKRLDFLGSCRTDPSKVLEILSKFSLNIESLTLCVNDELVSYGEDGLTCYAFVHSNAIPRPGLIFTLMAQMKNLKNLRLCGGFSTQWYFGELLEQPGCGMIETLDLKEFQEFRHRFISSRKTDFVQALLIKNKNHLKSIKLSETCARNPGVRECVNESQEHLEELAINAAQIDYFLHEMINITALHLTGRFQFDWEEGICKVINYSHITTNLEEINLIQFNHMGMSFYEIGQSFARLRVFRIDGNLLDERNIAIVAKYSPSLEKICVRNTNIVAKRHLVLLEMNVHSLKIIDFGGISGLKCTNSAVKLKKKSIVQLKVFGTGCDCKHEQKSTSPEKKSHSVKSKGTNNIDDTVPVTSEKERFRLIDLIMSNMIKVEFFSEIAGISKIDANDIIFHFNQ